MWVCIQMNESGKRKKYITASNYDDIIKYINRFDNVKKYDDYNFASNCDEVLIFEIHLGECLDKYYYDRKGK